MKNCHEFEIKFSKNFVENIFSNKRLANLQFELKSLGFLGVCLLEHIQVWNDPMTGFKNILNDMESTQEKVWNGLP